MEPVTIIILVFIISLYTLNYIRKIKRNPLPEPFLKLPIFGHLAFLGLKPHESLSKYGPIFSAQFGCHQAVILNDATLIKEAFSKHEFSGRPVFDFFKDRSETEYRTGVIFTDGDYQVQHRSFAFQHLKVYGSRKKQMRNFVQIEVDDLMEGLEKTVGQRMELNHIFMKPVGNAIWHILSGKRFKKDDPDLSTIIDGIILHAHKFSYFALMPPVFKHFKKITGYNNFIQENINIGKFISKLLSNQLADQGENNNEKQLSYYQAFQKKTEETTDPESIFHYSKSSESLWVIVDIFMAGMDTTSTSLDWTILYLAKYPEVRKKLQKEIDSMIGPNGRVSDFERSQLPYVEAVVNESLRYTTLVPLGLFHRATENSEIAGFKIKQDLMVVSNIWAVHNNKEIWGDPENFRPERFIDENGEFKGNENLLAFSIGKRFCLGKTLALEQLFLFLVTLYQKFDVFVEGVDLDPVVGILNNPKRHHVTFKKRAT